MGWITVSLRKQVLTHRVSDLENRLMHISQEQQTLSNSSSYDERRIGIRKQSAYSEIYSTYSQNMSDLQNSISSTDTSDTSAMLNYQVQLQEIQMQYMQDKMLQDSIFTAEEQILQDQVNTKQTYLDTEQEQVETQLEAARAELEQLDEAISSDIERSTISLT